MRPGDSSDDSGRAAGAGGARDSERAAIDARARRLAVAAGLSAAAIGAVVAFAHLVLGARASSGDDVLTMTLAAAIGLAFAGVGVAGVTLSGRAWALLGAVPVALALLAVSLLATGAPSPAGLFARVATGEPSRPALITIVALLLAGTSLLLLAARRPGLAYRATALGTGLSAMLGLAWLVHHAAFGVPVPYERMGVPGAYAFFAIAVGLLAQPSRPRWVDVLIGPHRFAGVMRVLVASALVVPAALSYLAMAGHRRGVYGLPLAASIDAAAVSAVLCAAALAAVAQLERAERLRAASEARHRAAAELAAAARARLEAEAEARTEAARLQAVADAALAYLATDSVPERLAARVRDVMSADVASIALAGSDPAAISTLACDGIAGCMACEVGPLARLTARAVQTARLQRAGSAELHVEADGESPIASAACAPLVAEGTVIGAICAGWSSRREVAASDARLLGLVAERAAVAVARMRAYEAERQFRDDARAELRERDDFLGAAAHELRGPLTTLRLLSDVIERSARDAQLPPARARQIGTMRRQIERLSLLVDRLLDVSRASAGTFAIEAEDDVDFAAVVRDTAARFEAEAASAGSALVLELPDGLYGRWDRVRLEQIATNLISNAIKYGRGGPVTVALEEDESRARLLVRDRGLGIAPEDRERIFERFGRGATGRRIAGVGLGLWITRELVDAMGGTIEVASEPGRGSTFTVELPRAGASARSRAEPHPNEPPPPEGAARDR